MDRPTEMSSSKITRDSNLQSTQIRPISAPPQLPHKARHGDLLRPNTSNLQERYNMSHGNRGRAIIINNKNFAHYLKVLPREGTDVDADSLKETFHTLGFSQKCILRYNDVTVTDMEKIFRQCAAFDYAGMDCCIFAILTHGEEGYIYGHNGKIALETLLEPFKNKMHRTLVGKPKIFLIQACRGGKLEDSRDLLETDNGSGQRLPLEADFLYAYSTVPGYISWRSPSKGSWFIQAFTDKVNEFKGNAEMDFVRLLTRVNHQVAYHFESNVPKEPKRNTRKQMPTIVSMLTKDLFFY